MDDPGAVVALSSFWDIGPGHRAVGGATKGLLVFALALRALARGQRASQRMIRKSVNQFPDKIIAVFGNRRFPPRIVLCLFVEETMRWKVSPHGHDSRQIDLLAIAALVIVVVSALLYFDHSPQPTVTSSFIVPSQNVRW
jgi:hypothetical protein